MKGPPVTVIVDTREQAPWQFSPAVTTIRGTLSTGDYSILGYENRIALERKSLSDFIQCCTYERERFWAELERLRSFEVKAIVIEGSVDQVAARAYRSNANPRAIINSAAAIAHDFGITVWWAGDRIEAQRYAEFTLTRFVRKLAHDEDARAAKAKAETEIA